MQTNFIGRKQELAELRQLTHKTSASLVVLRGRRRIGKSRLAEQLGKHFKQFFAFSGLAPSAKTSTKDQLVEFSHQFSQETDAPLMIFTDWSQAFWTLSQQAKHDSTLILLDEISWMGEDDPHFLSKLKIAWDKHFKQNNKLMMILCGSTSAWIEKNILASTNFLGRISKTIDVEELPLKECNQFLGNHLSNFDKLKLLSITGGVPRYLEEIQVTQPAEQTIKKLCFTKGGILTREFNDIFSDIFGRRSDNYKKIVTALADGPLNHQELSKITGLSKTGRLSDYINELILSGFVRKDMSWNLKTKKTTTKKFHYRLKDNYLRFYLKYIEPNLNEIDQHNHIDWSVNKLPNWPSTCGLQFENLVLNNSKRLVSALNINENDIVKINPYFQSKTQKQSACQIDCLIQTKFNTLFLCEIKFSINTISHQVIDEVKQKIKRIKKPRGCSVFPVLIHANGVKESVINENYFSYIIDMSDFL